MNHTTYTTKEGDRWDTVAFAAYGTVNNVTNADGVEQNAISIIAKANPDVPLDDIIPSGTVLYIPILEQASITQNKKLPPWK